MKFKENIDPKEFDEFVINHPFSHYMKTSFWAKYMEKSEKYQSKLVGIVDDNDKLLATAVILKKHVFYALHPYLYIPTGMCVDYYNEELFHFFIDELIKYGEKEKANFLRIDPNVLRCHRDIKGGLIDDGFNNEYIADYLKDRGFYTKGYGYAYNGTWINRYTLMLDIDRDFDDVVKGFTKSKQNVLKRQADLGISTRVGTREELKYLIDFEWDLTKTQGFKPHKVSFFERWMDILKDHIVYYVTEANLNQRIEYYQNDLNSSKYKKDPEAKAACEKNLAKTIELKECYGDKPIIDCGIFVYFGSNCWNLYNYNKKAFTNYNGSDNFHYYAIQQMQQKGIKKYDLVGFSGVCDKKDPYYNLYEYKSSFGSEYIERIGEFDYIYHEKDTNRYKFILRNWKRVKRKWYAIRYLEKK